MERAGEALRAHCPGNEVGVERLVTALRAEVDPLLADHPQTAAETFAARALVAAACEGFVDHAALAPLAQDLRERLKIAAVPVCIRALSDSQLLMLPLEEAVDTALALFEALGSIHAPAVWVPGPPHRPRLLRWRTEVPAAEVPSLVVRALAGQPTATSGPWSARTVYRFQRPCAVLTYCAEEGREAQAASVAAPLERVLSRAFERAALSLANAEQASALVRSSERRLTRVGFDLHDGPLQDVALLAGELDGVRSSLLGVANGKESVGDLLDRVDDLVALVDCLGTGLREVAHSLDSMGSQRRPFAETLNGILRAFTVRSGIEPSVELDGDIDALSDSQRITLLRVVQEALTNIRDHSGAQRVEVRITAGKTQVDAMISDDGQGFDVEPALRDAARRGRMGLLGIMERVRLLGGFCDIVSAPGSGTSVSLTVARWTPEMAAAAKDSKAV